MRQGTADRQAQEADVRQTALSKYLPQALQGDKDQQAQAMQAATPDQAIALSGRFAQMDAQTLAQTKERQARLGSVLMAVQSGKLSLDQAKQIAIQDGFPADQAAQVTEDQIPGLIAQNQTIADQIDQAYKAKTLANDTSRTAAQNAASYAAAAASARRGLGAGGNLRAPSGYQYVLGENGEPVLQPVIGGPADPMVKPLTDEQAKAAGFASRLSDADARLWRPGVSAELQSGYNTTVDQIPLISNALVTDQYQVGDQARRDFLNAQLRRESGAVIGPSEFDSGQKQYFPEYADKQDVLLNKAASRKQAIYNMYVSAGPRYAEEAKKAKAGYEKTLAAIQKRQDSAGGGTSPASSLDEADRIVGIKR